MSFNIFGKAVKREPQTKSVSFDIFDSVSKEGGNNDHDCNCPEFKVVDSGFELNGDTYVVFSDGTKITISKGSQGIQGIQGATGPIGSTGATGAAGTNGVSVSVSSYTVDGSGNTIVLFSDGTAVIVNKGDTGPAGANGANGVDGINGLNGAKGDKGDTGNTGPTGPTGSQGPPGTDIAGLPYYNEAGVLIPTTPNPCVTGKTYILTFGCKAGIPTYYWQEQP